MHPEKYNMNWQTFTDHLKELLHEMMLSKELTDVTLICDDKKQLKAHKIILSACSHGVNFRIYLFRGINI